MSQGWRAFGWVVWCRRGWSSLWSLAFTSSSTFWTKRWLNPPRAVSLTTRCWIASEALEGWVCLPGDHFEVHQATIHFILILIMMRFRFALRMTLQSQLMEWNFWPASLELWRRLRLSWPTLQKHSLPWWTAPNNFTAFSIKQPAFSFTFHYHSNLSIFTQQ